MSRVASQYLTAEAEQFVRMEANGYTTPEIIKEMWGMTEADDPKAYHNIECKLSRWRKHAKYAEIWKDEVQRQCLPMMSEAIRKLRKQMRQDDQWLGNKAANDLVAFSKARVFADEDKAVTVRIEGMPDLGSPDVESGID